MAKAIAKRRIASLTATSTALPCQRRGFNSSHAGSWLWATNGAPCCTTADVPCRGERRPDNSTASGGSNERLPLVDPSLAYQQLRRVGSIGSKSPAGLSGGA